jgi:hypothetical protein
MKALELANEVLEALRLGAERHAPYDDRRPSKNVKPWD